MAQVACQARSTVGARSTDGAMNMTTTASKAMMASQKCRLRSIVAHFDTEIQLDQWDSDRKVIL